MRKNIASCFLLFFALSVFGGWDACAQKILKIQKVPKIQMTKVAAVKPIRPQTATTVMRTAAGSGAVLSTPWTRWAARHPQIAIFLQRTVGISKFRSIKNVRMWGAPYTAASPRPKLTEISLTTADLKGFSPAYTDKDPLPDHPFQNQRQLIYRGLALDLEGAGIRNILENGLRMKDSGTHANTLMLSIAGNFAATASGSHLRLINLTDNADSATSWALLRLNRRKPVLVVAVVKSSRKGSIITEAHDIPAEDIYALTALLRIDGKPAWCKLELDGENLRITPYQELPPAGQP